MAEHERAQQTLAQMRQVMVATNGYTGSATPWHRRLVPVASYMIAAEPLGEERVRSLLPKLRVYGDTKKILYYFRPSPAFVRAPEGNGCAERFTRTLKENPLWVRTFETIEELRQALLDFRETYNST